MTIKINRLWHGYVSVRDYLVENAKERKEGLVIYLETVGEYMTIPYEKLNFGSRNAQKFKSKHDGREYTLIDYRWKADNVQASLFV